MKTIIGVSNFSFDNQHLQSFQDIHEQFAKLKGLQGKFKQHGVSLSLATDILKNKYFGNSIEEQFRNFAYGRDRQAVIAFRTRLDRGYFYGFDKQYSSEELRDLSLKPNEAEQVCCTLYAPKVLISGYSSVRSVQGFSDYYESILGSYPIDENSYYERATSHFTNLIYHSDCESTLDRVVDGFCNYSIAITQCLSALNASSPVNHLIIKRSLSEIASRAGYQCTPEGSPHENFKFAFDFNGTAYPKLDCQFHLKPSDRNKKGNGSHNHKRVYFGFVPVVNQTELRIAVAAIGPHITKHNRDDRYAPEKKKRKKVRRRGNS